MANGHGGKRPNSGPAKGTKYAPTLTKAEQRESHRRVIDQHVGEMLEAQITHAKGLKYLVTREKSGKFVRVTEAMAKARLGSDDFIVEVWEKDPSTQAFSDLMNRAYDKPKEQEQEHKFEGEVVFRWAGEK